MHELSIMEAVVDRIAAQLGDTRIATVRLEIGELAGVDVDALRFCFDVCTRGTPLAGSALEILAIAGRGRCRSCGGEHAMRTFVMPCACGSFDRELTAGAEIRLKDVEVL